MTNTADHEFLKLIYKGNISELYTYLRSSNTHPYEIKDYRGYSALHIAALNNNGNLVRFLIRYVKDIYSNDSNKILKKWSEEITDDEHFTCMHFAVFRGNLKIVKMFVEIGADVNALNKQGLSVMHIAA